MCSPHIYVILIALIKLYPLGGSKDLNDEYLAQTILITPNKETQSSPCIVLVLGPLGPYMSNMYKNDATSGRKELVGVC